jgi:hypothetical protein
MAADDDDATKLDVIEHLILSCVHRTTDGGVVFAALGPAGETEALRFVRRYRGSSFKRYRLETYTLPQLHPTLLANGSEEHS